MKFKVGDMAGIILCLMTFAFTGGLITAVQGTAFKERIEKDSAGREWKLKEWESGAKPFPKDLQEREAWYRKKWGENWYGSTNNCRIHNPGDWMWEVIDTVPPLMAKRLKEDGPPDKNIWGNQYGIMLFLWAPGGEQVTDIYVISDNSIYYFDPIYHQRSFIGKPEEGGLIDGINEDARLQPGEAVTLDPVTGRLYFIQGKKLWRYMEKLLPYECTSTKKVCYLPAALDWHEMYRKVKSPFGGGLMPVFEGNKRGKPLFVVRSNPKMDKLYLPGARIGRRPLIQPDGKGVFLGLSWATETSTNYDNTALFDIETGKMMERLKLNGVLPQNFRGGTDGPGSHGGNCMGYDGKIYTAQHGGCCGPCGSGGGRMFSIDPATGNVIVLYDSVPDVPEGEKWKKSKNDVVDGPADTVLLRFTSTLWQTQCPRTGAIINGGWDNTGIRRYHDGFVTSIVNGVDPPRPGWDKNRSPVFYHRNCNPSVSPDGALYIPDVKYKEPRIIRIFRTDWPKEQPVNGYAEKFMPKEKMESLMLEYAQQYIKNYEQNNKLLGQL